MPPTEAVAPVAARGRAEPSRGTPVALLALAGVLLLARVALGIVEHLRPVERVDLVEWRQPGAGEAEARAKAMLVLYCFTEEGSDPCRRLDREVFGDPPMAAGINQTFVPIRVLDLRHESGHNTPDVAALEAKYQVKQLPTLVVATADGSRADAQPGYRGVMMTRQFLAQAAAMMARAPRTRPRVLPDSGAIDLPGDSSAARAAPTGH